jgi:SAM-dependent methyltransferase
MLVDEFEALLKRLSAPLSGIIQQNKTEFGEAWGAEFESVLKIAIQATASMDSLVTSYIHFTLHILMSQKRYELSGVYENTSYEEVKKQYYDNPEFVTDEYMPGLMLSHYLWPHHYRLLRFFQLDILDNVATQNARTFCEVGLGTALYSLKTLQKLPHIHGTGYDISAPALAYGQQTIHHASASERFTAVLKDIFDEASVSYDFLICQEVLEHLEDPLAFTQQMARMIRPGGFAYITAALTAGQFDHIYLFDKPQEVYDLLQAAGLEPLMSRMDGARTYNDIHYRPRVAAFYCQRI